MSAPPSQPAAAPGAAPPHGAGRRLASGTFWLLASTALGQGAGLVTSMVIARILGREDFGAYGLLLNTVAMLGVFAGLGLGTTATKYVAELRASAPARAAAVVAFCLRVAVAASGVTALLTMLAAPWIAAEWLNAPALADVLRLSALLLFLSAVLGTQTGVLQGLEEFRTATVLNLVRGVVTLPLCVAGVLLFGLPGAIGGLVAAAAVTVALAQRAVRIACARRGVPPGGDPRLVDRGVLLHFALPALVSGVAHVPALWIANAVLAHQPDGFSELGVLNAAMQWRNVLLFLPTVVAQAALPIMSAGLATDEQTGDLSRVWALAQGASVVVVFPVCVLLMLGGGPLMALYGSGFTDGYVVLVGMIYSVMLVAAGAAQGTLLQARGAMWVGVAINLFWSAAFLVGVHLGVARFGAAAIAFAGAGSYLLATPVTFGYLAARGQLPAGALRLTIAALVFATAVTGLALLLSAEAAWRLAIPAAILTAALAATVLTHRTFREAALRTLAALRARWRPSYQTGS